MQANASPAKIAKFPDREIAYIMRIMGITHISEYVPRLFEKKSKRLGKYLEIKYPCEAPELQAPKLKTNMGVRKTRYINFLSYLNRSRT